MGDTHTGGGPNVGRDVNAGNDFVGRDKHNGGDGSSYGNRVDIHTESSGGKQNSIAEDVQVIKEALIGNPYRRTRGLLGDFETIVAAQEQAKAERKTISRRVTFLSNVSLAQSVVLFMIVMLVIGIIVYLGQIQLTPKSPTSGVHSPYETVIDYESGVTNDGVLPRDNEVP